MSHKQQLHKAERTFRLFHAKEPRNLIQLPAAARRWPRAWGYAGRATRVYYASDKWYADGNFERYYHDHGRNIQLWHPKGTFDWLEDLGPPPVELPSALTVLGEFLGMDVIRPLHAGRHLKRFARPDKGDLLCCDPDRRFLVAVDPETGPYAIIEGPGLTVEPGGIDG